MGGSSEASEGFMLVWVWKENQKEESGVNVGIVKTCDTNQWESSRDFGQQCHFLTMPFFDNAFILIFVDELQSVEKSRKKFENDHKPIVLVVMVEQYKHLSSSSSSEFLSWNRMVSVWDKIKTMVVETVR